jgi:hypothetical protein
MERELFTLDSAKVEVKCFGIKADVAKIERIHIYINGIDIAPMTRIESVKITYDKE